MTEEEYSGNDVMLRDINADGVFDQLFVTAERNELLKLDRGGYILLDGKWVAASRDGVMSKDVWSVGPKRLPVQRSTRAVA